MKPSFFDYLKDHDYRTNASYILRSRFCHDRNLFGCRGGSWYGMGFLREFISYGRNGTRSVPGAATVEGGICDDTVRPFEADTAAAAPLQPLVSKLGSLSG